LFCSREGGGFLRASPPIAWQQLRVSLHPEGGQGMTNKDKNAKKSMEKKPAQKTLKEKRQAKKAKK
jgi:hypothetical protein